MKRNMAVFVLLLKCSWATVKATLMAYLDRGGLGVVCGLVSCSCAVNLNG